MVYMPGWVKVWAVRQVRSTGTYSDTELSSQSVRHVWVSLAPGSVKAITSRTSVPARKTCHGRGSWMPGVSGGVVGSSAAAPELRPELCTSVLAIGPLGCGFGAMLCRVRVALSLTG